MARQTRDFTSMTWVLYDALNPASTHPSYSCILVPHGLYLAYSSAKLTVYGATGQHMS